MRVETLDLEFQGTPRTIAVFLIVAPEGPVLVETGPSSTLAQLVERLRESGFEPEDIGHVLVTHIHLDHAGAAGWWARLGARIYVHPVGAPHLIDPSRLLASAKRIYQQQMDELWGETLAAPREQVIAVEDGASIDAAGARFVALDTPGHARHHHAYRLGDIAFVGDAAGIRVPGTSWIDLPAPPPEFELEAWKATLDRLSGQKLAAIYRTHFGVTTEVDGELARFGELLDDAAIIVRQMLEGGLDRKTMISEYGRIMRRRAAAQGVDDRIAHAYELANPRSMSVDGIARYWRKRLEM